jgi:hypothetical protein
MRTVFFCAAMVSLAATNTVQGQESLSDQEALSRLVGVWTLVDWDETSLTVPCANTR